MSHPTPPAFENHFAIDEREFMLTQAEFEAEVEALRNSLSFQNFLEERSKCEVRIPIEEIEREIDEELRISSST